MTGLHQSYPSKLIKKKIQTVFSLKPLIEEMRENASQELLEWLATHQSLTGPIEDLQKLSDQQEAFENILGIVFPLGLRHLENRAMVIPFSNRVVFATQAFQKLFTSDDGKKLITYKNFPPQTLKAFQLLNAYMLIGHQIYGWDFVQDLKKSIPYVIEQEGQEIHYEMTLESKFIHVEAKTEIILTEEMIADIRRHADDIQIWDKYLPIDKFSFSGFITFSARDVTTEILMAKLRESLTDTNLLINFQEFLKIQEYVRRLLNKDRIILGLMGFENDNAFFINKGIEPDVQRKSVMCQSMKIQDFADSIFYPIIQEGKEVFIEDLQNHSSLSEIENSLLEKGIRNIYIAPLFEGEKMIGLLELFSPQPGDIYPLNILQLHQLLPSFSSGVAQVIDDVSRKIQLIIQEKYTAIHPSVSWKFEQAALNYQRKNNLEEGSAEVENIVFADVYPLFAMSDIRGSSTRRNESIREDLLAQLANIQDILQESYRNNPLSYTDTLLFQLENCQSRMKKELHSGDESLTIELFKTLFEPALKKLAIITPTITPMLEKYQQTLDEEHGVFYQVRKQYDENISRINRTLSEYLDAREEEAQQICPHYFEKNATDGVDFSMYVGRSLVENGKYDAIFLNEMRLWQLKTLCGIAKVAFGLKEKLSEPMDLAHLILVQNMPLTIQYMLEDKQFVVDGSYNIRYEILKKRIDKATVKGSRERITQPGKIAIIYSQSREGEEYREYIDYLISRKYLQPEVEEFALEELQGVSGLLAYRIQPIF